MKNNNSYSHRRPPAKRYPAAKRKKPTRPRFDEGVGLYKLIKTTKGNVIIRRWSDEDAGNPKAKNDFVAVLRGSDQRLLRGKEIENMGLCFTLSKRLLATKYVGNTFQVAVEEARALLEKQP